MASLPCPPQSIDLYANTMRSLSLSFHPSASHDERCAVRLNVPTVASLRRQSVISTSRTWPAHTPNMPLSAGSPSQISSLPSYVLVPGDASNARLIGGPVPFSQHAGGPQGAADSPCDDRDPRTASAESSPTTTISTTDSLLTGSSPGSSPESPTSSLPMHHPFTVAKSPNLTDAVAHPGLSPLGTSPSFDSESPGRRPRNIRNLAINTRGISTRPATTASLVNGQGSTLGPSGPVAPAVLGHVADGVANPISLSEPASPSFIIPLARKRPSKLGLTISTDAAQAVPNTPAFAPSFATRRQPANIPETPAFRRFPSLRESKETVFSPAGAPAGGMTLPPPRSVDLALPTPSLGPRGGMTLPPMRAREPSPQLPVSRPELSLSNRTSFEGGAGSSVIHHTVEHTPEVPLHDLPLSREVKSPSYPAGPACIYEPNVFLYHQPTAAQAREFDVIINVAREVPNPFVEEAEAQKQAQEDKGYVDAGTQCDLLNAPPLKPLPPREEEPETPRALTPRRKEPEYIHLPWEHNSRVYDSWLETCELIDARAKAGKRVLIHCQLGVSRSASLIVAYGLYLNPSLSPDEARELAKMRSKWIDLNMHFMYELGDFKKILLDRFPEPFKSPAAQTPPPFGRTRTEIAVPTTSEFEDESRRASIAEGFSKDEPSSAPADSNWSPTEPSLHDETFEVKEPEDSSELPTPVRADTQPEAELASRPGLQVEPALAPFEPVAPINELVETQPAMESLEAVKTSEPMADFVAAPEPSEPAKGLAEAAELPRECAPAPFQPSLSPFEPALLAAPPRRLRQVPSMPAGFHSIRKVSPNLTLDTQATSKPVAGAPELPPLDFGSSLMSPRTTEFVANPFHRNSLAGDLAGLEGMLSPAAVAHDPRSPPQKGEHPITRNIDDVL